MAVIWRGLAAAGLCLLLALVLAKMMATRIIQPLQQFTAAVDRVRAGDFSVRAEVNATTEFNDLLTSFNSMADTVRDQRDTLEATVADRTLALQASNAELEAQAHELAAQSDELHAQKEALQQRAHDLQTATDHKSQFLTTMSHELRTPLNAVIGFSELLLASDRRLSQADRHQFIGDINTSGHHLLSLINDILDLARIEGGHAKLEMDTVYPETAIGEAIALAQGMAVHRQITLQALAVSDLPVVADRVRVRQVLINLLSNSIKFSAPGSSVQVGSEAGEPGQVRFWVRDQGKGMDAALQARLFTPFMQGDDPMKKQHAGTGLGLAISRNLVQQMGGTIGVTSAPDVGSRFWFTLPLATGAARPERRATCSGHFTQSLANLQVLVVCNEVRDTHGLSGPLTALGANVRVATSMVAALEAALPSRRGCASSMKSSATAPRRNW